MAEHFSRSLAEKINPVHCALLVIDVQNDFCAPQGAFGKAGSDLSMVGPMVSCLSQLVEQARTSGVPILFVRSIYDPVYLPATWHERNARIGFDTPRCISGTWGADHYELRPQEGDIVVTKHRFSAFVHTELDLILRSQDIRTLIVSGIATNICVDSTARDAFMRDYYVIAARDACAAYDRALHEATLKNIDIAFGVVESTQHIIDGWQSA